MPSELLVGHVANGFLIRVVGRGTMQESPAFRAAAESNANGEVTIFDATHCDYLDSTFLGCLVGIKKACDQSPTRRFVIKASNAARIKLFSISSLDKYFDFIDNCPEPLDALQPVEIDRLDPITLGRHSMRCHQHLAERGGRDSAAFKSVADSLSKEIGESAAE